MAQIFSLPFRYVIIPAFLVLVLVLPYVGGAPSAYLESILAVLFMAWHFTQPKPLVDDIGGTMAALAFVILLVIWWLTNPVGRTDYLFAANFAIFLFLTPISAALSRLASPRNVLIVARLALAGASVAFAYALWQKLVWNVGRAEGLWSISMASAAAAVVLGFLATIGLVQSTRRTRYLYLAGPILGIAVILMSGSRGPLLAVPPMLVVLLFFAFRNRWIAGGIVAAAALAVLVAFTFFQSRLGRFGTISEALWAIVNNQDLALQSSNGKRLVILRASVEAFFNRPWLGYGWGEKNAWVRYFSNDVIHLLNRKRHHLHSDLLNFGVSGGLMGLTAYALIILAPVVSAWRSIRDSQYTARLMAALLIASGFAAAGAVNIVIGFEFLTTLYAMLSAIVIGFCRDAPMMQTRPANA